jgi:hypothetical protein
VTTKGMNDDEKKSLSPSMILTFVRVVFVLFCIGLSTVNLSLCIGYNISFEKRTVGKCCHTNFHCDGQLSAVEVTY